MATLYGEILARCTKDNTYEISFTTANKVLGTNYNITDTNNTYDITNSTQVHGKQAQHKRSGQEITQDNRAETYTHRMCGIPGYRLAQAKKNNLITGVNCTVEELQRLMASEEERLARLECRPRSKLPLELRDYSHDAACDVLGPYESGQYNNHNELKYIVILLTRRKEGTSGIFTKCIKSTGDAPQAILQMIDEAQRTIKHNVNCIDYLVLKELATVEQIKTDGAFIRTFTVALAERKINHYGTPVDTSHHLGWAERFMKTYAYALRATLAIAKDVPIQLWPHASQHVTYVLRRTPTSTGGMSPYQIVHGKPPSIKKLRVWGATTYVVKKNDSQRRKSLRRENIQIGINLGIATHTNGTGYNIYFPKENFISTRYNCYFHERPSEWQNRIKKIKKFAIDGTGTCRVHDTPSYNNDEEFLEYLTDVVESTDQGILRQPSKADILGIVEIEKRDRKLIEMQKELENRLNELRNKTRKQKGQNSEKSNKRQKQVQKPPLIPYKNTAENNIRNNQLTMENMNTNHSSISITTTDTRKAKASKGKEKSNSRKRVRFDIEAQSSHTSINTDENTGKASIPTDYINGSSKEVRRLEENDNNNLQTPILPKLNHGSPQNNQNSTVNITQKENINKLGIDDTDDSERVEAMNDGLYTKLARKKLRAAVKWSQNDGTMKYYPGDFRQSEKDRKYIRGIIIYDDHTGSDRIKIHRSAPSQSQIYDEATKEWKYCYAKFWRRNKKSNNQLSNGNSQAALKAKCMVKAHRALCIFYAAQHLYGSKSKGTMSTLNKRDESKYIQNLRTIKAKTAKYIKDLKARDIPIPRNIKEALDPLNPWNEKWAEAIAFEIRKFELHGVYEQAKLPEGKRCLGYHFIFTVKEKSDGSIEKFNCRIVAMGNFQVEGVDFWKHRIASPVMRGSTFNLILTIAMISDMELYQLDYSGAFLKGELDPDVDIYINPFPTVKMDPGMNALRLLRPLYGLKQGSARWFERLQKDLIELGFTQSKVDPCLFIKSDDLGPTVICGTWVDDCIVAVREKSYWTDLVQSITKQYDERGTPCFSKQPGPLVFALGMEILRGDGWLELSHELAIENLVQKFPLDNLHRKVETPMRYTKKYLLSKNDCPEVDSVEYFNMQTKPYKELLGALLHISGWSRPDIRHAVVICAQYASNPGYKHWNAVKHILKYLYHTKHLHLRIGKQSGGETGFPLVQVEGDPGPYLNDPKIQTELTVCSDSNWAEDINDRRSQGGYCAFFRNNLLSWNSKKQSKVALSTATAELYALVNAAKEGIYLKRLLEELGYKVIPTLLGDNQTANRLAKQPSYTNQTKHEHIGEMFVHEQYKQNNLDLAYVRTQFNVADIFTKPLPPVVFKRLRDVLLGHTPYAKAEEDLNEFYLQCSEEHND